MEGERMKKIFFIVWILAIATMFVACERDEEATLTTINVVDEELTPSYTSAEVQCRFDTKATLRNVYLQYASINTFAEYEEIEMQEESGWYKAQLTGLYDNTTYYIRYVASNRYSSIMTKEISEFKTLQPSVPSVVLDSITTIWDISAKAHVHLAFDGGTPIFEMGICWGVQPAPVVENNKLTTKDTLAILDITSLQPNTKYYARAYAKNKTGINYSEELSFLTFALPEVKTNNVETIQIKSAQLFGALVFNGNDSNTKVGFCWSEKPNPTLDGNYQEVTIKNGIFSYLLSELKDETKYYVRAYAQNKIGIVYGAEQSFTTLPAILPVVETSIVREITINSAIIDGILQSNGGASVTERGVVYSTHENPTTQDVKIVSSSSQDKFSCALNSLQENTIYHVRTYAINKKGIAYGKDIKFDVADYTPTGQENGYEYVDLGLGVKWAMFNIGASNSKSSGNYYAWGETSTKSSYTWSNYKYCNGYEDMLTKYNYEHKYGSVVDNREVLELTDDAAHVLWGSIWHIPTFEDHEELLQHCTWTWTTKDNVYGYKITSNVAGYSNKSIFLPVTGYKDGTSIINDSLGYYWCSSNLYESGLYIDCLRFANDEVYNGYMHDRYVGLPIRPVLGTTLPVLGYISVVDITDISTRTSVVINSEVMSDGGASVTERGVVYSTSQNPTISDKKIVCGSGIGVLSCELLDLQANTTYYVRAYAVNEKGIAYSELVKFSIPAGVSVFHEFIINGVSFRMRDVEGGTFTMGATFEQGSEAYYDEKPTHSVTLSNFSIGETEVTQELWQAVMGSNPSHFSGTNLPVEMVSWNDCQTFIQKLNQLTGKNFRLPTEAEWEFAARGGTKSLGWKYSGTNYDIDNYVWYNGNSSSKTHPVGQKYSNELWLYDMSGNVSEWCQDLYDSYSSSAQTNPTGPASGSNRVFRGGSWDYNARYCRVSCRTRKSPTSCYSNLGLRLVL